MCVRSVYQAICIACAFADSEMPLFAAFNSGLTGYHRSIGARIKPGSCKTIGGGTVPIRCVNTRVSARAHRTRITMSRPYAFGVCTRACVT